MATSVRLSQVKKTAAKKTTDIEDIEKALLLDTAKRQFLGATMNMGFRLAITVVIPIVIGVKLDQRWETSPNFTLLGLFLAAGAGSAAVWGTIKEVNQLQAEEDAANKKGRKIKRV